MSAGKFVSTTTTVPYEVPHRYWRIVVAETALCANARASINELQFFSDANGVNQVPNNAPLARSADGITPAFTNDFYIGAAFDGHLVDYDDNVVGVIGPYQFAWQAPPYYPGTVQPNNLAPVSQYENNAWLGQDFGNSVQVKSLAISVALGDARYKEAPTRFALQYSDDYATWTELETFTRLDWSPGVTFVFAVTATREIATEIFIPETDIRDYVSYIPPLHAPDPYFRAELNFAVEHSRQLQMVAADVPRIYYDVDSAKGVQLDKVGERVGVSRVVSVPIVHVFFTFNDPRRGFNLGLWQHGQVVTTYGLQSFDDETFRRLVRAKIIANKGDGSIPSAQLVLSTFLQGVDALYSVCATDYGASHMERCGAYMTVGFAGRLPPLIYMIALEREVLPIRPAGVKLKVVGTTVPGLPCFGLGVENAFIAGFGRRRAQAFMFGRRVQNAKVVQNAVYHSSSGATFNLPQDPTPGNLLVYIGYYDDPTGASASYYINEGPAPGWTSLFNDNSGTGDGTVCFYKVAAQGEGTAQSPTVNPGSDKGNDPTHGAPASDTGALYEVSGVDPSTMRHAEVVGLSNFGNDQDPAAITLAGPGLILGASFRRRGSDGKPPASVSVNASTATLDGFKINDANNAAAKYAVQAFHYDVTAADQYSVVANYDGDAQTDLIVVGFLTAAAEPATAGGTGATANNGQSTTTTGGGALTAQDLLANSLGFGKGLWNGAYLDSYTNRSAWARKPEYLADQGIVS